MTRSLTLLAFICLFTFQSQAQVGVNTTDPTATLDVNGTMRVRAMNSSNTARTIVGQDINGNLVPVFMSQNVVLENNELKSRNTTHELIDFNIVIPIGDRLDDFAIDLLPGEVNDEKTMLRFDRLIGGDFDISGLTPGEDGRIIVIYAVEEEITFLNHTNGTNSQPANRIYADNDHTVNQYDSIMLMYNANIPGWVILSRH